MILYQRHYLMSLTTLLESKSRVKEYIQLEKHCTRNKKGLLSLQYASRHTLVLTCSKHIRVELQDVWQIWKLAPSFQHSDWLKKILSYPSAGEKMDKSLDWGYDSNVSWPVLGESLYWTVLSFPNLKNSKIHIRNENDLVSSSLRSTAKN